MERVDFEMYLQNIVNEYVSLSMPISMCMHKIYLQIVPTRYTYKHHFGPKIRSGSFLQEEEGG